MTSVSALQPETFFADPVHDPFVLGDGPIGLLMLHGFMGTPAEFRPLAHELIQTGQITCYAPLLPGFGRQVNRLPQQRAADWIIAAQNAWREIHHRHPTAILLGYSMGGALAVLTAADTLPTRLILLAPFSRLLPGDWRARLLPLIRWIVPSIRPFAQMDFDDPETRRFFAESMPGLNIDDPTVREGLRNVRFPLAVLDELRKVGLQALRAAARIACPTLVIQGTLDTTVPPATTRALIQRMPAPVTWHDLPTDHTLLAPDRPFWAELVTLIQCFAVGELT